MVIRLYFKFHRSVYDVLCEIFYFRTTATLLMNIIGPFLHCHSPAEVKEALDSMRDTALGPRVHAILFNKGLANNLPKKILNAIAPPSKSKQQSEKRKILGKMQSVVI